MDKQDALNMLKDAQEAILGAIANLKDANRILKDRHAEAYIIDHLEILASDDHGFLSRDYSLSQWIADVERGDEDEDNGDNDD